MSKYTFVMNVPNKEFQDEDTTFVLENITRHIPFFKRGVSLVTFNVKNLSTGELFHDIHNDTHLFHMLLSPSLSPEAIYIYLVNNFKMQYRKNFGDVPTDFILARLEESALTEWHERGATVTSAMQVEKFEIFSGQLIVSDARLHFSYIKNSIANKSSIAVSYTNAVEAKYKLKLALENLT